jgi:hypothetical protein
VAATAPPPPGGAARRGRTAHARRPGGAEWALLKEVPQGFEARQILHRQAPQRNGAGRRLLLVAVAVAEIRMQLHEQPRLRRRAGGARRQIGRSRRPAAPAQRRLLFDRDAVEDGAVFVDETVLRLDAGIVAHEMVAHFRDRAGVARAACANAEVLLRPRRAEALDELTKRHDAEWIIGCHGILLPTNRAHKESRLETLECRHPAPVQLANSRELNFSSDTSL